MAGFLQIGLKSQQIFLPIFLILLLAVSMTISKTNGPLLPTCPTPSDISPCTCNDTMIILHLTCHGPLVTNEVIKNLFSKIWATVTEPDGALRVISRMKIMNTTLKNLDMTPFRNVFFSTLEIGNNPELTEISGSMDDNEPQIEVLTLSFTNAALTDMSLATLLTFVNSSSLSFLVLTDNKLRGSNFHTIFEPFLDIDYLYLNGNQIQTVGGGQFQHFRGLQALHLEHNGIATLGPDAFLLHEEAMTGTDDLDIWLDNNQLTDDSIDVLYGLDKIDRKVTLRLDYNKFEFISAEKFEKFLLADTNLNNVLWLFGNDLICDEKLMWLRTANDGMDGRLEDRVIGAYCKNDPGKTIFNTRFPNNNNHGGRLQAAHHVLSLVFFVGIANLLKSNN